MLYAALILLFFFDDNDVEDFVLLLSVWLFLNHSFKQETFAYPLETKFFSKVIRLSSNS
jgi:hypothetical protein